VSEGETATGYLLLRVSLFLSLELLCVVKEVCPSELVGRVARALHGGQEAAEEGRPISRSRRPDAGTDTDAGAHSPRASRAAGRVSGGPNDSRPR